MPKNIKKKKIKKTIRKQNKINLLRKKLFYYGAIFCIWFCSLILIYSIYLFFNLPDINKAKLINHKTIKFYDKNNQLITQYGTLQYKTTKYEEIPSNIISALLATEDHNFFDHNGLDLIAVIRAAYANLMNNRKSQGGSTITQQLAKIIYLNSEKTFQRKFQELFLAFYLEYKYTKEEILEMYLNNVYFGAGIYGIAGASRYYFNQELSDLNPLQAAMLVGMLKAPTTYNPINSPEKTADRTLIVLKNMLNNKFITKDEFNYWIGHSLFIDPLYKKDNNILYFTDFLLEKYAKQLKDNKNVKIKTYIDFNLQKNIERLINQEEYKEQLAARKVSQLAILVLKHNGEVVAYLGGMNYFASPFNRVFKMKRQSGSLFKLFTYLSALEYGIDPNDVVEDKYIKIGKWVPRNYSRRYYGKVSIKDAFAKSLNASTVYLTEKIGRQNVINTARKLGITSPLTKYPSVTLGVDLLNLEELTRAYNMVANNCSNTNLKYIKSINGNYEQDNAREKVCSYNSARKMDYLLRYNMQQGTGRNLKMSDVAGKSGTSNDYKDAWFIGYNKEYTIGIWMGNDDNKPMDKVTGGSLPARLWKDITLLLN